MKVKRHLYDLLCVDSSASVETITRSYRKLALEYHPDRNPDGAEKFKQINNAYATLCNEERRRLYDATGIAADQGGMSNEDNGLDANGMPTQQHSSELEAELRMFFATYANSPEEEQDVITHYNQCNGNFRVMMKERLLFDNGEPDEVNRLYCIVLKLIELGKLTLTEMWTRTTSSKALRKLQKELEKEKIEAEAALVEMGLQSNCYNSANNEEDNVTTETNSNNKSSKNNNHNNTNKSTFGALQTMIQQRQQASWTNMLSNLEDKYVTKSKKRTRDESVCENSKCRNENKENRKNEATMPKAKSKTTNAKRKEKINKAKPERERQRN